MAFKPAGVGLNKNINRNQSQTQNSLDELVVIDSYDVARNIMYGHRDDEENPRQFEITIKKSEVLRAEEALEKKGGRSDTYGWMGHSIDEKMQKKFPKGSKVILVRATQVGMNKETNRAIIEAHRVNSVNVPEKTFRGILTLSYRIKDGVERISRIQHWDKNGINVNSSEKLELLRKNIDEAAASYGEKMGEHNVTKPSIGFQFRTLRKTDKEYEFAKDDSQKAIYQAIDFSVLFDWMMGEQGADGSRGQGHLVTGDEFMEFLGGYVEYIRNHETFKHEFDNLKVEVCPFSVYLASAQDNMQLTFNNHMDEHKDKNPLYQLAHRKSYIDLEQTEMLEGRNAAVHGILQLTADRVVKIDGKLTEVPNNWAVRVHANNYRGHVHAFIRTEQGEKVIPHEKLALLKSDDSGQAAPQRASQGAAPAAPAAASAVAAEVGTAEFGSFEAEGNLFGDDNGFMNTGNDNLFGDN